MTLTLAGHHPPLVLRATGEVDEVGRLSTALALFEESNVYDIALELAPGDVLCAFTDGLIEARQHSDMFGSGRVADLLHRHGHLPVDELAGLICESVRAFHADLLQDDLALLLVRAGDRPGAAIPFRQRRSTSPAPT